MSLNRESPVDQPAICDARLSSSNSTREQDTVAASLAGAVQLHRSLRLVDTMATVLQTKLNMIC